MNEQEQWRELGQQLRVDSIRAAAAAGSGHPTSSMSAADLMAVLLAKHLRYDFDQPENPLNDHLVFSKGHASPLVYSIFRAAGAITDEELLSFRKMGSRFQGHPTPILPWVDVATGSLGQGLPIAVGIALAGKRLDRLPFRVWVVCGDSEMAEGSMWEAFAAASHENLDNLTAIIDVNRLGQRGETMLGLEHRRLRPPGGGVRVARDRDRRPRRRRDRRRLRVGGRRRRPAGGDHRPHAQGQGRRRGREQERLARQAARGPRCGHRGAGRQARPAGAPAGAADQRAAAPVRDDEGAPRPAWDVGEKVATRRAYGDALVAVGAGDGRVVALDGEVGNSTYSELFLDAHPDRYFEMYIAEQQMVAAAVGMQVRGWRPFASTFAAFFARAYDFTRMAAISQANMCLAGSHAGVSIGEDGPSQMALEDLASFRAVHGSTVLYPSCANQTAKLGRADGRPRRHRLPAHDPREHARALPGRRAVPDRRLAARALVRLRRRDGRRRRDHAARGARGRRDAGGRGHSTRVIDLYSVKPIDAATLAEAAEATGGIVVVEDHWPEGGLHEAVLEALTGAGVNVPVTGLAPTGMPTSGTPAELLDQAGIDRAHIADRGAVAGRREAVAASANIGAWPRSAAPGPTPRGSTILAALWRG